MLKRFIGKHKLVLLALFVGITYGLVTRLFFDGEEMVTLTYMLLVPAVLGVVPLVFASDDEIRSGKVTLFIPWMTVATAFLALRVARLEELICLFIMGIPFFLMATVAALLYRWFRIRRSKKGNTMLTIALIPFLFSPLEEAVKSPSEIFTVVSEVQISSASENVWRNIIRVPSIRDNEYNAGYFNYLGIPRPIEAELYDERPGALRIGHFDDGLTFIEHITDWKPYERVSFDIIVDPKTIRNRVFDQHVLSGDYFSFVNATYEIEPLNDDQVTLRLVSSYRLTSKINFYNRFWGDLLLQDFQDRLLAVIKLRCDDRSAAIKQKNK